MEKLIFKTIVGSQSYGTNISTSDIDIKGVYMQSIDDLITFNYKEQYEVSKDECYFEIRRFLQLLQTANPTALELLFSPDDCILETSEEFKLIVKHRDKFLTKKCRDSFGGYAVAQIKKARGLDKKQNWEKDRVIRKTPIDFIYVYENGKTLDITKWLLNNNLEQENCGLIKLNHFKDCYALYYDYSNDKLLKFKGIFKENSNNIRLSSIPKGMEPLSIINFNIDGYSAHCKDYKEYQDWLQKRNITRYTEVKNHDQKIDGKNLMHCRRLLDMAIEIAETGTLNVKRPNADYLLSIRRGELSLDEVLNKAEEDVIRLNELYSQSNLPDNCDKEFVNDLLLQVRKKNYL